MKKWAAVLALVVACGGGPDAENCTQAMQQISEEVDGGATAAEVSDRWEDTLQTLYGDALARDATSEAELCQGIMEVVATQAISDVLDG